MKSTDPSRRRASWMLTVALLAFVAFIIYRSLQVSGYRCEICVTFAAASACGTVDAQSEDEARRAALTNACAKVASGVTDSLACERSGPTRITCGPTN